MSNEPTSTMRPMSSKENISGFTPRAGQQAVVDYLRSSPDNKVVAAKLPGGYGKSIAIALSYATKRAAGQCDRLLIVVANDTQRQQIRQDFASDCSTVGIFLLPGGIWEFNREPSTVRMHKENRAEVFVATIQQVSSTARSDIDTLLGLILSGGKWMLAADEYHHYGEGMDWGTSLKRVRDNCTFTLALSATPDRDGTPSIFGDPQISVSYRDGIKENALKEMKISSYHYAIDLITQDGEVLRYTTDELLAETENIKNIDKFEEKRKLRYSTKYIHPLILHPATRLQAARANTGKKFQLLIRAMSCRHAQAISEQVKGLLGDEFVIEWVGTGDNGRTDDENRRVCKAFCPSKKGALGRPTPTIDVLVQVGMAGEGFDSVLVTEIVDLSLVRLDGSSNQTKQFYLRGARWVPGIEKDYQICTINVPSDHPLTELADQTIDIRGGSSNGDCRSVIDWIDSAGCGIEDLPTNESSQPAPISDWRSEIRALDPNAFVKMLSESQREIELINITEDKHFISWLDRMSKVNTVRQKWDVANQDDMAIATQMYKSVAQHVANAESEQMMVQSAKERVNSAVGKLANIMVMAKAQQNKFENTTDKSHFGDQKKRINGWLLRRFGSRDSLMIEDLKAIYNELVTLEKSIRVGEMPSWAM